MSDSDESTRRDIGRAQARPGRDHTADESATTQPSNQTARVPVDSQTQAPLIVWIGNDTQLEFHRDQKLIIVRRRHYKDAGQEIFPVDQVVSVGVDRSYPPDRPMGMLRIHLSTGRTVTVEFPDRLTGKVEEFQRTITGAPEPAPGKFPFGTCLGLLIGFIVITLLSLLVARLVMSAS